MVNNFRRIIKATNTVNNAKGEETQADKDATVANKYKNQLVTRVKDRKELKDLPGGSRAASAPSIIIHNSDSDASDGQDKGEDQINTSEGAVKRAKSTANKNAVEEVKRKRKSRKGKKVKRRTEREQDKIKVEIIGAVIKYLIGQAGSLKVKELEKEVRKIKRDTDNRFDNVDNQFREVKSG